MARQQFPGLYGAGVKLFGPDGVTLAQFPANTVVSDPPTQQQVATLYYTVNTLIAALLDEAPIPVGGVGGS